jgi:dTDP-4-dehydrorhamnose reductase
MNPRILITGSAGQLARALGARLGGSPEPSRVWMAPEDRLDIGDPGKVREALAVHRPDWIVNCAAYTAVDAAEADRERAFLVNDAAVGVLADAALDAGARILHLSTDYVFDGSKPGRYVEEDLPNPVNAYGASKLAGEIRLLAHPVRAAVLRTAWLYGEGGRNFFRWAVEGGRKAVESGGGLPVVIDQVGSPTDVHTLSAQIEAAIEADLEGLHHAAAEGETSWHGFAEEIFRLLGITPRLRPIRGEDLRRAARRAPRVVLENRRLHLAGRNLMVPWQEGLRGVVSRFLGENKTG